MAICAVSLTIKQRTSQASCDTACYFDLMHGTMSFPDCRRRIGEYLGSILCGVVLSLGHIFMDAAPIPNLSFDVLDCGIGRTRYRSRGQLAWEDCS